MEIVGYILIVGVVGLLFGYFRWSRTEEQVMQRSKSQTITVRVEGAYKPNVVKAKSGKPIEIIFDRKESSECSKKVIFADLGISAELTDFGETRVEIDSQEPGEYPFSCEMGMYQGKLIVEK